MVSSTLVPSEKPQVAEKTINLDLGEQRRHSFLPTNWAEGIEEAKPIDDDIDFDDGIYMYVPSVTGFQQKPMQKFCTGSKYLGQWGRLGIAGKGVYKYPHGAIYDGFFNRNGEFHGTGMLVYPNGHRIEGVWKNGKLGPNCNYISKGGVQINRNYCLKSDRRFHIEIESDFKPVGQEYLTNETPPPREIPEASYDLVEGYFDSSIKAVIDYPRAKDQPRSSTSKNKQKSSMSGNKYLFSGDEMRHNAFSQVFKKTASEKSLQLLMRRIGFEENKIISWIPSLKQEEWIVKNCRKAWDEPVGYRPDLYEEWTKGGRYVSKIEDDVTEHDSKCNLRALNLYCDEGEDPTHKRFTSFVTSKKDDREALAAKLLMKRLTSKVESESSTDLKIFSSPHMMWKSNFTLRRSSI